MKNRITPDGAPRRGQTQPQSAPRALGAGALLVSADSLGSLPPSADSPLGCRFPYSHRFPFRQQSGRSRFGDGLQGVSGRAAVRGKTAWRRLSPAASARMAGRASLPGYPPPSSAAGRRFARPRHDRAASGPTLAVARLLRPAYPGAVSGASVFSFLCACEGRVHIACARCGAKPRCGFKQSGALLNC